MERTACKLVVGINDSRSPRPGVDAGDLEAEMPTAGVGALTFGPGAHAVTMSFSVLPATAVSPTVVKVESAPVNLRATSGGTGRPRLRRTYATCLWQLGAPRYPVRRPGRLLAGVRLLLHLSQLPQALSFVFTRSPLPPSPPTTTLRLLRFPRLRLRRDRYRRRGRARARARARSSATSARVLPCTSLHSPPPSLPTSS